MARLNKEQRRIDRTLDQIQKYLQVTNNEFEMYFLGILKVPPQDKARELKRMFRELTEVPILNTSLKFKARTLTARHNSFKLKWLRTCKQIENGTYHRHRALDNLRSRNRADSDAQSPAELRAEIKALIRGDEPPPKAAPKRKKGPRGHEVGSDALFEQFKDVQAQLGKKRRVNRQAVEDKLRERAAQVKKEHGCKEVRFQVVAEGGRSRVKVIPVT